MDNNKLHEKLDLIIDRQAEMNATLVVQATQLEYHIKRTDLLEEKLQPVEQHVALMSAAFKIAVALGSLVGVLAAGVKLLEFFKA
jgi:hypothetical protein